MPSSSPLRSLPKSVAIGTLALAAASAGTMVAASGAANAANPTNAPSNGPIAYTVLGAGQTMQWHDVNPDGSQDTNVPVLDAGHLVGGAPGQPEAEINPVGGARFSPDGSRAVFGGVDGCLYLGDADGTKALALTADTVPHGVPCVSISSLYNVPSLPNPISITGTAWSADSRELYASDRTGALFTISEDGTKVTKLPVSVPAGYQLMSVSPNGTIAFLDNALPPHILLLDPGEATPRVLTAGLNAKFSTTSGQLLVTDWVTSPSGAGVATLFLVDPVGGARTQITDPTSEVVQSFAWSPDGKQVAYTAEGLSGDASSHQTIYSRAIAGGGRSVVAQGPDIVSVDSWHNGPITPSRAADRIGGADRISTAIDASQWSYARTGTGGRQASVAVISRDDQFADALGGSALAAQKGGPLLLTPTGGLDSRVGNELTRVLARGSVVYILGGDAALSPTVEQKIRALGFTTKRLAGADRFSTSVAVAEAVSAHPHTVMVATGVKFPDALAAGAAAAQDPAGGVVILSDDAALPVPVKKYLSGVNPAASNVYGVGGQGVAALRGAFPQWAGRFTPLSGADRFATAAAVAGSQLFTAHGPIGRVGLATGMAWPDALSGGALIATQHGPLLLTDPSSQYLPSAELNLVKALAPHLSGTVVFGGPQAVGTVAINTATSALGANGYFMYLNRQSPELAGPR